MPSKRLSKWKRHEVSNLLQLAGWSLRSGAEGHVIAQKDKETITLGTDPVHKNAVAEVERALGVHIEKVVRKQKGKIASKNQIQKRLILAKQMDAAGFDSKTIKKKCGLTHLYTLGFSMPVLREQDPAVYAAELYKKVKHQKKTKVQSSPGQGRLPSVKEMADEFPKGWREAEPGKGISSDDVSAILDLLGSFDGKLDDKILSANRILGSTNQRLKIALDEAKHLKILFGRVSEAIDRLIRHLGGNND